MDEWQKRMEYFPLRRWMNGRNVFDMEYLVVPFNAGGMHWVCLVVNLKTMNVWCVPCHALLCVYANAGPTFDLCVVQGMKIRCVKASVEIPHLPKRKKCALRTRWSSVP
jgi:hypothetical protein